MLFSKSGDEKKPGFFEKMKSALGATKANLVARIETVLSRGDVIDDLISNQDLPIADIFQPG